MMDEDAVVPVDFMTLLDNQVIEPLEKEGVIRVDGSGSTSTLSLYSYYNLVVKGKQRLHYPSYINFLEIQAAFSTQMAGLDPTHNADEFMNADEYFPSEIGIPRKHVQPSLVNHKVREWQISRQGGCSVN